MHLPAVVQVAQRRSDVTQQPHHAGNVVRACARQACAYRLTRDPAPQITRTAPRVAVDRPVVIRGWNSRMVSVGEMSRLGLQPSAMFWIRRAYERQRSAEGVHDLLIVS